MFLFISRFCWSFREAFQANQDKAQEKTSQIPSQKQLKSDSEKGRQKSCKKIFEKICRQVFIYFSKTSAGKTN